MQKLTVIPFLFHSVEPMRTFVLRWPRGHVSIRFAKFAPRTGVLKNTWRSTRLFRYCTRISKAARCERKISEVCYRGKLARDIARGGASRLIPSNRGFREGETVLFRLVVTGNFPIFSAGIPVRLDGTSRQTERLFLSSAMGT